MREAKLPYVVLPGGMFRVNQGSTYVLISPTMFGKKNTFVRFMAPVSIHPKRIGADLTKHLLKMNNILPFGAFSISNKEDLIFFKYSILGNFLDSQELINAIVAVAFSADKYDEEISAKSKGKRAQDR